MDGTCPILTGKSNSIETVVSLIEKLKLSDIQNPMTRKYAILAIQFLEYASTHLIALTDTNLSVIHPILKEINEMLFDTVYLMGCKKTDVDDIFYHMIYPTMSKLSTSDKENYVHVSRWFNHLQSDDRVRQSKPLISFNRTLLYV